MAEAFNCHFANIGHELAKDILPADTVLETYLISTNMHDFLILYISFVKIRTCFRIFALSGSYVNRFLNVRFLYAGFYCILNVKKLTQKFTYSNQKWHTHYLSLAQ